MTVIVLTGMPATGKSTICSALADRFGYPVVEKDAIKEELFDTIGFTCYAEKRALDHAANAVVIHIVEQILKADGSSTFSQARDSLHLKRSAEARRTPLCLTSRRMP